MEKGARETPRGIRIDMARVMADMIALRTTAIDAAVRGAIARGVKQLVILGAGYDGRAWRMPTRCDSANHSSFRIRSAVPDPSMTPARERSMPLSSSPESSSASRDAMIVV